MLIYLDSEMTHVHFGFCFHSLLFTNLKRKQKIKYNASKNHEILTKSTTHWLTPVHYKF